MWVAVCAVCMTCICVCAVCYYDVCVCAVCLYDVYSYVCVHLCSPQAKV